MSRFPALILALAVTFLAACGGALGAPRPADDAATAAPSTVPAVLGDAGGSPTAAASAAASGTAPTPPASTGAGTAPGATLTAGVGTTPTGASATVDAETAETGETMPAGTAQPVGTVGPAAGGFPLTYTDAGGAKVTLEERPERIIALFPANNETLFAIGAGDQIIAVDDFTTWPAAAAEKPKVGGNGFKFDIERIVSLEPDLVISGFGVEEVVDKPLREANVPVINTGYAKSLEDVYTLMRDLGRLSGHTPEAEREITKLQAAVSEVEKRAAGADKVRVYFETDASTPGKPYTVSPGSLADQIIGLAGGRNVFANINAANPQVSYEAIVDADPHVILLGDIEGHVGPTFLNPITVQDVRQRTGFDTVRAVRANRLVPINPELTSPGPRVVQGLRQMAAAIHPEIFSER